MLRSVLLAEQVDPPHLIHPWLFPVLAGWLWLQHTVQCLLVSPGPGLSGWVFRPGYTMAWLLGGLVALGLAWSLLVQLRRIDARGGVGFVLCGFGLWVVQWVDTLSVTLVELPPHYLTRQQLGQAEASLCIGAGYVAYAVGVGLVVGDGVSSWLARSTLGGAR